MAHFRGTLKGNRAEVSRLGSKRSGLTVEAQSWRGKIVVDIDYDPDRDIDVYCIRQGTHEGAGTHEMISQGIIGQNGTLYYKQQVKELEEKLRKEHPFVIVLNLLKTDKYYMMVDRAKTYYLRGVLDALEVS
jgi:hypothetical protein